MNPIVKELKERGLWAESFGQIEKELVKGAKAYVGTDPTNPTDGSKASLHVGHLLMFTTARLLQSLGIQPIILIGTATSSQGDPSGKDQARAMMTMDRVMENTKAISEQVKKLLDFNESTPNHAILVNNYDWIKNLSFLDFEREVGSHISVNTMLTKESVKRRIEREGSGISHMEFSYMLIQAYDFYHLYNTMGCKIQMAGNDQQSNVGMGIDLIHKKLGKDDAAAFFWPLLTNADGSKMGKTSGGKNVWLDPEKTSPYEFMQFWVNQSDADAERFIKLFTLLPLDEINSLIEEHRKAPEKRMLQKRLAEYMTVLVHSKEAYDKAVAASNILFGKSTVDELKTLDDKTILSVFKDVPRISITLGSGMALSDIAIECKDLFSSKGDFRKLVKSGGVSLNKAKVNDPNVLVTDKDLLNGKYLLMQKGKKYSLVVAKQ